MQQKTNRYKEEAVKTGSEHDKTEFMPIDSRQETPIKLNENNLTEINKFTYVGSVVKQMEEQTKMYNHV